MPKKLTTSEYKIILKEMFPNLELISDYNGDKEYVTVKCKKHNHVFNTKPNWLKQSKFPCRKCYEDYKSELTREKQEKKFKQFLEENINGIYNYSEAVYVNNKTKVKLICPKHGEFYVRPDKLMSRHDGCPYCKESHLERETRKILDDNSIAYIAQFSAPWLKNKGNMFIDFFLPQHNIAIECQGEQHLINRNESLFNSHDSFEDKVKRDKLKQELCTMYGIEIIYVANYKHLPLMENMQLYKSKKTCTPQTLINNSLSPK